MLAGAEILLTPKLGIARNGYQAAISWNAGLSNFNLYATTNFANWSVVQIFRPLPTGKTSSPIRMPITASSGWFVADGLPAGAVEL